MTRSKPGTILWNSGPRTMPSTMATWVAFSRAEFQSETRKYIGVKKNIAAAKPHELSESESLILGASTWEDGQLQQDWKRFLPRLEEIDLAGKTVALFGLGNAAGFSGEFVNAGTIIVRQRGTRIHPGHNVGKGKDDTLFALITGIVKFERMGKSRKKVSVYAEA